MTIGVFDGIHLGHKKVIESMLAYAKNQQIPSVVITFSPHPAYVLGKMQHPQNLLDADIKTALIASLGVDYLITIPFTTTFAAIEAEQFVTQLSQKLNMKTLVTGQDFALGKDQRGKTSVLQSLSHQLQFALHQIPEVDNAGNRISSTYIRKLIADGRIGEANHLLGRYYHFSGAIVDGDHRGRQFGYPTANLIPDKDRLLPKFGVYATFVHCQGRILPAITNVGYRPTFNQDELNVTIETFILDFQETIYSQPMDLYFAAFIRPEMKFSSSDLLYKQIDQDILKTREILADAKQEKNLFIGSTGVLS
ncbi:MAG: bifunctional riboflavin kinase/FAD synthetase [Anaerolineaceae bacterium]|nr:bifunctional riboflavin kinase/FAD synthetase [Anaerolineaceae bacterium]